MLATSLVFLLVQAAPALGFCPATAAELGSEVEAALAAYDRWEWAEFTRLSESARADLACLSEVPPAGAAMRAHLLAAFVAARQSDAPAMRAAFRGVLSIDEGWEPSMDQAAPGSTIRQAFDAAREAGRGPGIPLPPGGTWVVDGKPGATLVPTERAALVQFSDGRADLASWYLDGSGVPPDLASHLTAGVPQTADGGSRPDRRGGHASRNLVIAGLGTGLLAGGALLYAESARGEFVEAEDEPEAERIEAVNHLWGYGGYSLGAAAGGLVLGAVIHGRW